jgi:hypothetical protein
MFSEVVKTDPLNLRNIYLRIYILGKFEVSFENDQGKDQLSGGVLVYLKKTKLPNLLPLSLLPSVKFYQELRFFTMVCGRFLLKLNIFFRKMVSFLASLMFENR